MMKRSDRIGVSGKMPPEWDEDVRSKIDHYLETANESLTSREWLQGLRRLIERCESEIHDKQSAR